MSINEALNILGLNSNFSEKELKRAYYALVKKYHPDQFEKSSREVKDHAETMMKKINQAYETLQNMSKSNGFSYGYQRKSHNTFDVKAYVFMKKAELEQKYLPKKYKVNIFKNEILAIENIINSFFQEALRYGTKTFIDDGYIISVNKISKVFKKMKDIYFQKYNVDISALNVQLNYDCSFDEFYEQLESVKNKYEQYKNANINKVLKEASIYESYYGYNYAKVEIHNIVRATLTSLNQNVDAAIYKMHEQIQKVFKEAFAIKQEIVMLQVKVEETNNEELLELFTKLKTNFDNGCSFRESQSAINYLKHLIYLNDNLDSEIDSAFARVIGIVNSITEEESELRKNINIWFAQLRNDLLHTSLQNISKIIDILNLSNIKQIIEFLAKSSRNYQEDNSCKINKEKEDINNKYYKYNTEYNYDKIYNIKYDYDYINYKKRKY